MLRYDTLSRSAGNKKFVSATAVADKGDSQAFWVPDSTPFRVRIAVSGAYLHNRSGSTAAVGLAGRIPAASWVAGQITSAGAYTADTTDAQDEGTNDFPMLDRTDSGSGFLIGCYIPFNVVGIVQGVAGDQTATLVLDYWNGTAWTALTTGALVSNDLITGTGEKLVIWPTPSDWAKGGTGTGVPSDTYNMRLRHTVTVAGTTNPSASQIFIGHAKLELEGLADNGTVSLIHAGQDYTFPSVCDALFPVFSVASAANTVEAGVRNG